MHLFYFYRRGTKASRAIGTIGVKMVDGEVLRLRPTSEVVSNEKTGAIDVLLTGIDTTTVHLVVEVVVLGEVEDAAEEAAEISMDLLGLHLDIMMALETDL